MSPCPHCNCPQCLMAQAAKGYQELTQVVREGRKEFARITKELERDLDDQVYFDEATKLETCPHCGASKGVGFPCVRCGVTT